MKSSLFRISLECLLLALEMNQSLGRGCVSKDVILIYKMSWQLSQNCAVGHEKTKVKIKILLESTAGALPN